MIGTELLDDPRADARAVRAELEDIARLNALFGGTRAVVGELEPVFRAAARPSAAPARAATWTLLDVGTGIGDIPRAAAAAARRYGIALRLVAIEQHFAAARLARDADPTTPLALLRADGGAPPLAAQSVDIVIASQVLHHLSRAVATRWIAGLDRLARRIVVLADLRRSRLAMAGVWAAALALGMDRVTRHDAVVSLRRGYTTQEFDALLAGAGIRAAARRRPGFRIVASWRPTGAAGDA